MLKECKNLQNLDHTKLVNCEQAYLIKCELLRDNLKIFGDSVRLLQINHTFSVDGLVAKWIAFESPFRNLHTLNLSYN